MEADGVLAIDPTALGENRHICAFFNGMDDHYRVLRSFITEGFHQGERAFHVVDPEPREDHLRRLGDAGVEHESRLNELLPEYDHPVICAYDLSRFRADTAVYALRTHPLVIISALIQENPFYVEPDQLLRELRERRSSVGGAGTAR